VALPLPLAGPVTVSHPALLAAVQAQPAVAESVNDPLDASAATDTVDGDIVYVQGAAVCEIVTIWLPTEIVPLRGVGCVFAATW
jgi:hypothetical protein